MIRKILTILLLLLAANHYAQGLKVLITEEKKGKRVQLFAENKTQDTLNIFLTVNAEGYRRSASKPVVKDIPPKAKLPMLTLIELDGVESRYTFDLVVNDAKNTTELTYDERERDIERVIRGQLVIFSSDECGKCQQLADALTERRIQHRLFNLEEDAVLFGQFMSHIERSLTADTKVIFPVIWNRDEVIFGYDDLNRIIGILDR